MIKIDIVKRVAKHLKLKDSEALTVVDAIIDSIKETVCEDNRLEIRDFGVFKTKLRKERTGRNPRNRKEYPIPARRVVTFKLGRELKEFSTQQSGRSRPLSEPAAGNPEGSSAGSAGRGEVSSGSSGPAVGSSAPSLNQEPPTSDESD